MRSISEFGVNVPAFLAKLWKMVDDPSTNDLILWSPSGTSFLIRDQTRFCKELLPMYYKHNNLASFIRQLNMYGFHKVVSVDAGSTNLDHDENEFHHPCFIKDRPYMLEHIKRKITGNKIEGGNGKTEVVNKVLLDVRQMRSRQETMDSRLSQMKLENEALWRELSMLRQKHMKQQQIVNKLIQFLVSLVQHPHNNGISVKRRTMPLMLQDKAGRRCETSKCQENPVIKSPSGPVIHELDPAEYATALLDTVEDVDDLSSEQPDQFNITVEPSVEEAESALQSVDQEMPLGEKGCINDDLISGSHFLIDSSTEMQPSKESASSRSLLISSVPSPTNPLKVQKPTFKKGRPKKIKPKNCDESSFPVLINTIINPETQGISGTSNEYSDHITPDVLDEEVDINEDVTLDDLATICPPVELINNSNKCNNSSNVPDLIQNQFSETKNNSAASSKNVSSKRYNIGKNASMLFKSKKPKISNSAKEKLQNQKLKLPSAVKQEILSPANEIEESQSKSPLNVDNGSQLRPAPSPRNVAISSSITDNNTMQNNDMTVACTTGNSNSMNRYTGIEENRNIMRKAEEVDNHIDSMQTELDSLKELLKCENLSLDANALLGLFNPDDSVSYNGLDINAMQASLEEVKENDGDNSSNKITMYSAPPTMLDLNDVFNGSDWSLPMTPDPCSNSGGDFGGDLFPEVNTPNISLSQPSFGPPAKKKKK